MGATLVSGADEARHTARGRIEALRRTGRGSVALYVLSVALVAAAYYAVGRVGLELAYLDGAVAAMWPPAGLGLAVLFLYGVRLWPGIVIGDLLLGDFSTPLGTVLGQTVGNTVAVVVAALLLRRLTGGRGGLTRVVDVLALVACAVVAAVISAAFGPTSLRLGDVIAADELGRVFRTWTLSDASGILVVAPVVLTWATARLKGIRRRDLLEGAVALVVLVVLAELPPQRDVPYIVFPVLLWTALRFGPRGAALAILVVCSITVWNTAQEDGPFVRESITDSLLATQLFIAISALTSLLLAAVTAERTRAAQALSVTEAEQRRLAAEQAALRRVATLVASEAPPSRVFERVTEEVGRLLGLPGATVVHFDGHRTAKVVGAWSRDGTLRFPLGATLDLDGDTVIAKVLRTGSAQRVESYGDASGTLAEALRGFGYRAAVAAPVHVGGRLWGTLAAASASDEPLPEGLEQQLCDFADLVAQALANADAYQQLAASRAHLVEVGDAERRRLERNLHDGAQQRLVSVALELSMVSAKLDKDPQAARELLAAARDHLAEGLDELRELARGIHPAILTERGLGPALAMVQERAPVPVEIVELPSERLPAAVEAAAYYVVAEAITNVVKYARASRATVEVSRSDATVTVTVSDDGAGGADPAHGSGLRGLAARVAALDGRVDVDSPPGRGTRVTAQIPLVD
ncbi:MAG TPA: MASE1 domain-containing protein [Solirubrobacteraceae bacterium]|nr:MASE1 domain-containing protein [Solirubrobacteraceae bacterium]